VVYRARVSGVLVLATACATDPAPSAGEDSGDDESAYSEAFTDTQGDDGESGDTGGSGSACGADVCLAEQVCDAFAETCIDVTPCTPDRTVGEFTFCWERHDEGYVVVVRYDGSDPLDFDASQTRLGSTDVDLTGSWHSDDQTFVLAAQNLSPRKVSYLFRMRTEGGQDLRPLFIPMWIGPGMRYSEFGWNDAILYQVMTDRFLNGDPSNDLDNSVGSLAEVDDPRSRWQGGDFAGITAKIEDGYFESMGINALWISSPILNSHESQPSVDPNDTRRFSSYHAYHPVATGYTHLDDWGYDDPIEPAFGTADELHTLVETAHIRGIRVIPDFVANHVHAEAAMYDQNPQWFFPHQWCDGNWDTDRINCWFTPDMPDLDYGGNPAAVEAVVDHALWMVQEFDFDGFRADALKHMDDAFVRALKTAVVEEIETTIDDHSVATEAEAFYMVGESLGGWSRYHVREDMVQGQVDEDYYQHARDALLSFARSIRELAEFSVPNDTAYLNEAPTMGGAGGYPGAIMGNFFGNHDQWRALTEAGGTAGSDAYRRLRLAQTFLFTSPRNVPMLYQGDDIGTEGEGDPDNRAMQRFDNLSAEEQASLDHARALGTLRETHPALRRGLRVTVALEDWFWAYRVQHADDEVYVVLNRDADKSWSPPAGFTDALGTCSGGVVPWMTSCVFVRD
jgi:glycosidase